MDRGEQLIRTITEGTAPVVGDEFFRALVEHLATALQASYAFVAECLPNHRARSLAFWQDGKLGENFEYDLADTPCLNVVAGRACFYPDRLQQLFPKDTGLVAWRAESYHGVPVLDSARRIVGHLVILDDRPMSEDPLRLVVLETFAARAGAELERVRADQELRSVNRELDAMLAMNRAIGRHLNRDELFGALAWSLNALVPTDRFGIELPIEGGRLQGHILTPRGAQAEPTQPTVLPAAGTACAWVMEHREWVVTASRDELREQFPVTFDVMSQEGMESLCAMPLVSGERCRGALFFMAGAKGAYEHVRRGFLEQVVSAVSVAVDDCLAHEELRRLRDRLAAEKTYLQEEISGQHNFEEIVGSSAAIKRVFNAIEQVAATDATVLLLGETGTGKELIARAIHNLSGRKDHVLVKVNCAAIPPGLIESELFGHEKGAFTGALARKVGRFELADGATLFLDEVGDLPLDLQPKLLRVLQEGEFERLGSTKTIRTDVRLIAATNRDLERAVEDNAFRADLFYRLNVFPIRLPALRERPEDVSLLIKYFVRKCAAKLGKKIETIPQATLAALQGYSWPGNVRELENVIERAVILTQGSELDLGDWLPKAVAVHGEPGPGAVPSLEELERAHILHVLERTGWRVSGEKGAARLLGLKPTTLEARMRRLGITRPGTQPEYSGAVPA
jgi:formate hydrogenlyase transcriptional activator